MQLLEVSLHPTVFPFSVLFVLSMLYWSINILGIFDFGDIDIDVDLDADVEGSFSISKFFGFGDVPIMILITILSMSMWMGALISYVYLTQSYSLLYFSGFAINLILGLIVVRIFSKPFVILFRALNKRSDDEHAIVGSLCISEYEVNAEHFKEGKVKRHGAPLLLNVVCREGTISPKQTMMIVDKKENEDIYIVEVFNDWKE